MTLPTVEHLGDEASWQLPFDVDDESEQFVTVRGRFIGFGTSHQTVHRNHLEDFAPKRHRCRACRWFETRIFTIETGGYVLHHTGASIVPDEFNLHRFERAQTADEVIDIYLARHDDADELPTLNWPAMRALLRAADHDERIRDAYLQRAVS